MSYNNDKVGLEVVPFDSRVSTDDGGKQPGS